MTWIKPSFLWMMYRSGCGYKDVGQSRVLAIDISRTGFEWALENSTLSTYAKESGISHSQWLENKENKSVRIQWDPERNIHLEKCSYRSIQIGISKEAVKQYINQWIVQITDITSTAHQYHEALLLKDEATLNLLTPTETMYPVPNQIAKKILA